MKSKKEIKFWNEAIHELDKLNNPPAMYKEDLRTNTVDGARAFEQARHERYDIDEPDYDEQEEDFEDECGCSDTCCPCGGRKRGTP